QDVFHIAHVAGTDLVNAPLGMAEPESEQAMVDGFAALCEAAAGEGLRVSLEFMPFNSLPDLATAYRVIRKAGCNNGGIMLDCWHHHRGGGMPEQLLQIPGEHFFALQLDDAMPEPMADMLEETLNHRRLPGEGCIDLAATLGNLRRTGADVVCDVEVFDDALRALAPAERARRLFDSSKALLSQLS
ncbi:MAG: sugar phosphate isomerase/epimerase, partial [Halioglobus sp.]|nr:sugar phosphate isomerase/epimerase [Halioglobus sp.]